MEGKTGTDYKITVLPGNERLTAPEGESLFRVLIRHGYPIPSACGGMGTCGKCRVLLHKGARPPTAAERVHLTPAELEAGWRLACQQRIDRDMTVEVPQVDETTRAKELLKQELHVELDPGIRKVYLKLPRPGRDDQRPDTIRLGAGLTEHGLRTVKFPLTVLQRLPRALREGRFRVTATVAELHGQPELLDVEPGGADPGLYGLALDIGTTTLAGYLLDLNTGRELAVRSRMNPQRSFGADVIARIKHVRELGQAGLQELQTAVLDGINGLINQLCRAARIAHERIYKVTIAGNPTMMHLIAGVDPSNIDHSPYIPVLRDELSLKAGELRLAVNREALVLLLPAVSAYVGADIAAGVLYTGLYKWDGLALFLDIGTNAEIVLGNRERLLACSTPAGPAFEGALIKHGMSAVPGAIAHAWLSDDGTELRLETIGNLPPQGICGSGLIDIAAELLRAGLIDEKGRLRDDAPSPLITRVSRDEHGHPRFLLAEDRRGQPIYLTQQDIRELQLAKGAIRSGVEIVLREWGATPDDVDIVYLAGAFGNYIRRESVLRLGMLPLFPKERLQPVGNAAGQGAKMVLLNRAAEGEIRLLVEKMHYFELSYHKGFSEVFIQSMYFPQQEDLELKCPSC